MIFPRLESKPEGELKIAKDLTLPCRLYDNLCTVSKELKNECPGEVNTFPQLKKTCSIITNAAWRQQTACLVLLTIIYWTHKKKVSEKQNSPLIKKKNSSTASLHEATCKSLTPQIVTLPFCFNRKLIGSCCCV